MYIKNIAAPAVAIAIAAAGLHGCGTAPQEAQLEQSADQADSIKSKTDTENTTDTAETDTVEGTTERPTEESTSTEEKAAEEKPTEETIPDETPETVSENTTAEAAPEFDIESIPEKTMYATQTCNVRSGPSTDYDKVAQLTTNQEVTVNGKVTADNGKFWYVIKTDDNSTQMVSGSLLSDSKVSASSNKGTSTGSQSGSTATGGSTTQAPSDCAESDCSIYDYNFCDFSDCEGWTDCEAYTHCNVDMSGITAE